jgi:hypothetical protein
MKAVAVVAHPDDCVIFAYGFIHHYAKFDWTIVYLTYTDQHARAQEIKAFWQRRGIKTKFLGYSDNYRDLETQTISFDTQSAARDILISTSDSDLILTHNHLGEYGHLHHKFVHQTIADHHDRVVYFSSNNQGNIKYEVPAGSYSLDELPLHRAVVGSFFTNCHVNEYVVSDPVKSIL